MSIRQGWLFASTYESSPVSIFALFHQFWKFGQSQRSLHSLLRCHIRAHRHSIPWSASPREVNRTVSSFDMTHNPEQKRRKRHPIDFAHVRDTELTSRPGAEDNYSAFFVLANPDLKIIFFLGSMQKSVRCQFGANRCDRRAAT